jgi:hypothetical protein|tara:strand:+ start:261 stop:506 length:246 start_codon:yes stop_codon:yes gene_type:complete
MMKRRNRFGEVIDKKVLTYILTSSKRKNKENKAMQNRYTRERVSSTSRAWDRRNKRKVAHKERQLTKRAIRKEVMEYANAI